MSTERDLHGDVNRVVRSWLREDRHEDANRVLNTVLDELDTTPQRRPGWSAWRDSHMNRFVAIGLGAAAVVVVLFIGSQLVGQPNVIGPPAETPSPSAAPSSGAGEPLDFAAIPQGTALEPGQYYFDHDAIPRVIVTVPAGWEKGMFDFVIWSADGDKATLAVVSVDNLYIDPCRLDLALRDPAVGPTVNDLVEALGTVPGWEFSAPTAVTVDGFAGEYVEYVSAPSTGCSDEPVLWRVNGDGSFQPIPTGDDVFRIWILDVDGTRLVITTNSFPAVPASSVAGLEEIFDSIQIEP